MIHYGFRRDLIDFFYDLIVLIKYLMLGLIQGFTEALPISSSGHLVIIREIFNLNIHGLSFEIIVNFGSLIAVFLVYREDIFRMTNNGIRYIITQDQNSKADFLFISYLIIATCLTGVLGLMFEDYIISRLAEAKIVGYTLLITGVALWIIRNLKGEKADNQVTLKDAIIVGIVQVAALVPGISRSGVTIVAGMLLGMKRETSIRFSFLLFIPVSVGITSLSINNIISDSNFHQLAIPYLIGFMASIVATFYSLKWFINIMARGKLKYFSIYCFIVGTLVIIFI